MAATILDGRALAAELRGEVIARAAALRARGVVPCLAIVLAGGDHASEAYVRAIETQAAKTGLSVHVERLAADAEESHVRAVLHALGDDRLVHGIMVQQPLPGHLAVRGLAESVPPEKDVDGASPANAGRLALGHPGAFVPATPQACMLLLARSRRAGLRGVRACVVGRSAVVGLPVALLLLAQHATVTIVHSRTREMEHHTRDAEVLVAATGVPGLIRGAMVAPGATVIDVGTTYVDGKLYGDVAFDEVVPVAAEITPVPGGVGPVTNVALLQNVVAAAERLSSH